MRIPSAFITVGLALLAIGSGGFAGWQRIDAQTLRAEWSALQATAAEETGLRAENVRLKAQQIAPADLEKLRADHAAVARLRAEVNALKAGRAAPANSPAVDRK